MHLVIQLRTHNDLGSCFYQCAIKSPGLVLKRHMLRGEYSLYLHVHMYMYVLPQKHICTYITSLLQTRGGFGAYFSCVP